MMIQEIKSKPASLVRQQSANRNNNELRLVMHYKIFFYLAYLPDIFDEKFIGAYSIYSCIGRILKK